MDIAGKTVVVTGASSGLGAAIARRLKREGAAVVPVGHTPAATEAIADELGVTPITVDFADLADVHKLAATLLAGLERIDILANNAGALYSRRRMTVDGNEKTFQVNTLAPYLLTRLLLDRLRDSGGKVIATSSQTIHRMPNFRLPAVSETGPYEPYESYSRSKLGAALLTREFARRHPDLSFADFHPGVFPSNLVRDMQSQRLLSKSPLRGPVQRFLGTAEEGAEHFMTLARSDTPLHGDFYSKGRRADPGAPATNRASAAELWRTSAELANLPA